MRSSVIARFVLAAALVAPSVVSAQTVATTTAGGASTTFGTSISIGYLFNVTSPFTVSYLAYWDEGGDGLIDAHHVSIWSPTGQLLVDGNVAQGSAGILSGGHRLVQVDPFTLSVGDGYRVGGSSGANDLWSYAGILTNAPGIQWTAAAYCTGTPLQDVGSSDADCGSTSRQTGYFGGNFAGVIATPEPASVGLLATGLIGVFGVARRRRNKTAA